jgi:hypothetical protein
MILKRLSVNWPTNIILTGVETRKNSKRLTRLSGARYAERNVPAMTRRDRIIIARDKVAEELARASVDLISMVRVLILRFGFEDVFSDLF